MKKTFSLIRNHDATGVSGTGNVAEGIVFSDGSVALKWLTNTSSTGLYASVEDVLTIHGHGGDTLLVYDEPTADGQRAETAEARVEMLAGTLVDLVVDSFSQNEARFAKEFQKIFPELYRNRKGPNQ